MSDSTSAHEHVLAAVRVSPDQFTDCAQAVVHTILFNRSIETGIVPRTFRLSGVDIAYVTTESPESRQYIVSRLTTLQDAVFTGIARTCLIVTLSNDVPRRGWFRDSYASEPWERWCVPFVFGTLTAHEMRASMLAAVEDITKLAAKTEIQALPEGGVFRYTLSLPTDKDWENSRECVRLVQRITYPRA
jgi:hypothetical protein